MLPENEGKVVLVHGKPKTTKPAKDSNFPIEIENAFKLMLIIGVFVFRDNLKALFSRNKLR